MTDFYTLPEQKYYYDNNNDNDDDFTLFGSNETLSEFLDFVQEKISEEEYVKVSQLTQIEGKIAGVNILYAGFPEAGWSEGLWPHRSSWELSFKNEISRGYQMSNIGDELTVGTFIHETAHLICGWPDFYAYDNHFNNNIYGLGMQYVSSNSKSPMAPSPLCLDWMGWLDKKINITNLDSEDLVTLHRRVGEAAVFYGTKNMASLKERYYLEVRKFEGNGYYSHPFEGLFI